jgi:hypothetical protein
VPTDHGREAACQLQNRHTWCASDRTAEPWWPTVGAGLLLLSLALAGDGRAGESTSHVTLLRHVSARPAAERDASRPTRGIPASPIIGIP